MMKMKFPLHHFYLLVALALLPRCWATDAGQSETDTAAASSTRYDVGQTRSVVRQGHYMEEAEVERRHLHDGRAYATGIPEERSMDRASAEHQGQLKDGSASEKRQLHSAPKISGSHTDLQHFLRGGGISSTSSTKENNINAQVVKEKDEVETRGVHLEWSTPSSSSVLIDFLRRYLSTSTASSTNPSNTTSSQEAAFDPCAQYFENQAAPASAECQQQSAAEAQREADLAAEKRRREESKLSLQGFVIIVFASIAIALLRRLYSLHKTGQLKGGEHVAPEGANYIIRRQNRGDREGNNSSGAPRGRVVQQSSFGPRQSQSGSFNDDDLDSEDRYLQRARNLEANNVTSRVGRGGGDIARETTVDTTSTTGEDVESADFKSSSSSGTSSRSAAGGDNQQIRTSTVPADVVNQNEGGGFDQSGPFVAALPAVIRNTASHDVVVPSPTWMRAASRPAALVPNTVSLASLAPQDGVYTEVD